MGVVQNKWLWLRGVASCPRNLPGEVGNYAGIYITMHASTNDGYPIALRKDSTIIID